MLRRDLSLGKFSARPAQVALPDVPAIESTLVLDGPCDTAGMRLQCLVVCELGPQLVAEVLSRNPIDLGLKIAHQRLENALRSNPVAMTCSRRVCSMHCMCTEKMSFCSVRVVVHVRTPPASSGASRWLAAGGAQRSGGGLPGSSCPAAAGPRACRLRQNRRARSCRAGRPARRAA